jgi:uncharacterized protein YgiM (DUF1202 family)
MKKNILLIAFLFFSLSVFSASTIYVETDASILRSDKSDKNDSNIIKTLSKDTKLELLTMHFSGWSKVSLGGTTGWILSNELTQNTPKILAKVVDKNTIIKLQSLEEELLNLKQKNQQLSSESIDIKALNDKIKNKNKAISKQNIALQAQLNSPLINDVNWYLAALLGLLSGFIISAFIARLKQKKRNSFNTINRSY